MHASERRRHGISLIELLVVVGIVAVLTGLITVAVQKVRQAAWRAEKANWLNERRLGATPPTRKLPISILFIGNSLTQNGDADLPQMLNALVQQAEKKPAIEFDMQVIGGRTLLQHWDGGPYSQKNQSRDGVFFVVSH